MVSIDLDMKQKTTLKSYSRKQNHLTCHKEIKGHGK